MTMTIILIVWYIPIVYNDLPFINITIYDDDDDDDDDDDADDDDNGANDDDGDDDEESDDEYGDDRHDYDIIKLG